MSPARGSKPTSRARSAARPGLARLWAPWRMEFVAGAHDPKACLFCRVAGGGSDRADHVIARRPHAFVMLNRYPYAPAHLMVAVARHVAGFDGLEPAEREDLLALTALGERLLRAEYHPDGLNVGANLGTVAGAGFPGHLHLHLVPRWNGDTNFMATVGETRVLPESLEATWTRLTRALRADAGAGREPSGDGRERSRRGAAGRSRRRG